MSEYVTIIEATINQPVTRANVDAAQLIKSSRILQPQSTDHKRFLITVTGDPLGTRANLARVYPFAPYRIIHTIRAENRSELLNEVFTMKLRDKLIIHNWYDLYDSDILWLRSITTENYAQMIPQIQDAIAAENGIEVRDVTRRKATRAAKQDKPGMSEEEIEAMRQQMLDQIQNCRTVI